MNQGPVVPFWGCERVDWLGRGAYRGVLGKCTPVVWKGRLTLSVSDFGDPHACQVQRKGEGSYCFLVSQNLSPKQARG